MLAIAAILAFATVAFTGGGYTFGLLSDGERTEASIQAASDFVESPTAAEAVSFRGCGEVRLRMPENASFSLAVTLSDASADARKAVTLTDADAGSEASGFRYASGPGRYRFDLHEYEGGQARTARFSPPNSTGSASGTTTGAPRSGEAEPTRPADADRRRELRRRSETPRPGTPISPREQAAGRGKAIAGPGTTRRDRARREPRRLRGRPRRQ